MSLEKQKILMELDNLSNELLPIVRFRFFCAVVFFVSTIAALIEMFRLPVGDIRFILWTLMIFVSWLLIINNAPSKSKIERYSYLLDKLKRFD